MPVKNDFSSIHTQLNSYKRKFHLNAVIRGLLFFLALIAGLYLLISTLEYYGRFSTTFRAVFLFVFVLTIVASFIHFIAAPFYRVINLNKAISDEEASRHIGEAFPEIRDKLLNAIQLQKLNSGENELIFASIGQRTEALKWYKFPKAVRFSENKRFLKYLIGPLGLVIILFLSIPELFSDSNERIINYSKSYAPVAPYKLSILNKDLRAFTNEDFKLEIKFEGNLPENAFILDGNRRVRLKKDDKQTFSHVWRRLQRSEVFRIDASGFISEEYKLEVVPRPDLSSFNIELNFPNYTGLKNERLTNLGNIAAPLGTTITWNLQTQNTESVDIQFDKGKSSFIKEDLSQLWKYKTILKETLEYSLLLKSNQDIIRNFNDFQIQAINDEYPAIKGRQAYDSLLFNYVIIGGEISDDYGFTKLQLNYSIFDDSDKKIRSGTESIKINNSLNKQAFIKNWTIDSLDLSAGQKLEYFVQVTDNDGFNGPKSTRSKLFKVELPSEKDLRNTLNKSAKTFQSDLSSIQEKAEELNQELNDLMDETKTKKELEWKDKNKIEQVLKKHEELKKELDELNKSLDKDLKSKKRFEKQSEEVQNKTDALKNLMNEILDEETKELLKELQKLLEEKGDNKQMQNKLENLENKSYNIEKELDRAIELFKQLQFEDRMEKTIEDLNELANKQDELAEKNNDKSLEGSDLAKEQEEINKEFSDIRKELDELKKLDESMENPNGMEDTESQEEEISESLEESKDQLQKNKSSKASESQNKSSKNMKEMSKKLSDSIMGMESQALMEDMNNLRQILENLVTLSFDQEDLMKEFKKVNQSDPRYVELGQDQLKLRDDAQIIEDSLFALAKRVFQIESFVTREVNEMNKNMEDALEAIKERKNGVAAGKQQFAMTSINNLALMLNDVLKQMQEQMASQMEGDQMCNKPKKNGKPSMSMLQQGLNEKIRQLKQSGKQGRELSEELSDLARQQEELRQMLEGLDGGKSQLNENSQKQLSELEKIMEESEKDLVHKRLTQELLERQEDILSRLLESEKAQREQQMDPNRESQTADEIIRKTPPDLDKYLKEKEKETELLKTISPFLNSYYREMVNDYFEKIFE